MGDRHAAQLPNGLRVILQETHTAPLVSAWVWYRVGSRDEVPGKTGISHWVEHMQFRGTPRFPSGIMDKTISKIGGYWNAMTSSDWTTYFLTLPAAHIELALDVESDRMMNSLFKPEDVESERTIIISERMGSENSPFFLVSEEVQAAAFRVHAYHHEVIGDMADLEIIQRDALYQHYRQYYCPNNAVLSIAGDFKMEAVLEKVDQYFGSIPSQMTPDWKPRQEPRQSGERRLFVEGPGDTRFVQLSYHVPQATHPDFIPLVVLSTLLTGPLDMNMFDDGGLSNKTARLYQALVDKDLAVSISGSLQATIDPYLYNIILINHPDCTCDALVDALDTEIDRICQQPPGQEELTRAVKQARAMFAYGAESITNQAYWLGYAEMFADITWYLNYLENLAAVTPQDVQRVAQQYLLRKNRVRGDYWPNGNGLPQSFSG